MIAAALRHLRNPQIEFVTHQLSTADATSYSFTQSLEPGLIVVWFGGESLSANVPTFSGTFDGNAMSLAQGLSTNLGASRQNSAILYYRNTSSGSKTIIVNFTTTNVRCRIGFWRITGNRFDAPVDTDALTPGSASDTSGSVTIAPAKGCNFVGVAGAVANTGGLSATWTGANEAFDTTFGAETGGWASAAHFSGSGVSKQVTLTWSSNPNGFGIPAAAWS